MSTYIVITGVSIRSVSSDPSNLQDGDFWYNSTSGTFKARVNGSTVTVTTS